MDSFSEPSSLSAHDSFVRVVSEAVGQDENSSVAVVDAKSHPSLCTETLLRAFVEDVVCPQKVAVVECLGVSARGGARDGECGGERGANEDEEGNPSCCTSPLLGLRLLHAVPTRTDVRCASEKLSCRRRR